MEWIICVYKCTNIYHCDFQSCYFVILPAYAIMIWHGYYRILLGIYSDMADTICSDFKSLFSIGIECMNVETNFKWLYDW